MSSEEDGDEKYDPVKAKAIDELNAKLVDLQAELDSSAG